MNNLEGTYYDQGKNVVAEVLYKQCLDQQKSVLGENYPDTYMTIGKLADLHITRAPKR